jgi:F0F1-type ATP synthase assembly protein I
MSRNDQNKRDDGSISWNQAIIVGGLAMSVPGILFGPAALGYFLDPKLGTAPWLTLAGFVVGLIATAIDVWIILKRIGMLK